MAPARAAGAGRGTQRREVAQVRDGAAADGWRHRQWLLLRAADELHEERTISDDLWAELRPLLDQELIEPACSWGTTRCSR